MTDNDVKVRYFVHFNKDGNYTLMDGRDSKIGADSMILRMEIDHGIKMKEIEKEEYEALQELLFKNSPPTLFIADRNELERDNN